MKFNVKVEKVLKDLAWEEMESSVERTAKSVGEHGRVGWRVGSSIVWV